MSSSINLELLEAFFEDSRDVLEEWERVVLKLSPNDTIKAYEPILRCAHNLKGSAGMMGLSPLHHKMHEIEDYLVKIRDQGRGPDEAVVAVLLEIEHALRRWMEHLKMNTEHVEDTSHIIRMLQQLTGSPVPAPNAAATTPTAPLATQASIDADLASVQDSKIRSAKHSPDRMDMQPRREPSRTDESLRVSAAKLDQLIQLVGEISLHQAILDRAGREGTLHTASVQSVIDLKTKLTQDLQDAALSLRMIPVQGLFQKVERVAREAAGHLNKQVQVNRRGEEVSLDKLVVDGMLDPLIHIARNAVDHGIELVKERIEKGKNPFGSITMTAENTAAGVTIIFEDDGRGIDAEKVYRKALERGIVGPDQELNHNAKLHLIFMPGLSTAETVTEFSGRGVGMDVVAETVKRMGGRVEIESALGKGTRMIITLPTNFSILDALVIKVNGCQYAIPNQDLAEVLNLNEYTVQPVNGGESHVIDIRGKVVPVEELSSFLDHRGKPSAPTGLVKPGVIVAHRDERLCLAVDKVMGQQRIFVRPVIGHLSSIGFYGGSTILSDGEPTIILNLPEMARRYFTSH